MVDGRAIVLFGDEKGVDLMMASVQAKRINFSRAMDG